MRSKLISRIDTLRAVALLLSFCVAGLLMASCAQLDPPQKVTKGDVNLRISQDIPIGSTKTQAIAFLDSLEINGFKAKRGEYISPYRYPDRGDIKGYLGGCIRGVRGGYMTFDSVCMMLYFDENEKLVHYEVDNF